jgi:uncharacterized protein
MTHLAPYAALLALLFVALSWRTITLRRRLRVAVGDGGHPELLRAMRVHANFAEYVPLALLLIALVEIGGSPAWLVHVLGTVLLLARCAHAWGVSQTKEDFRFRISGMMATFGVLGVAAAELLRRSLWVALA